MPRERVCHPLEFVKYPTRSGLNFLPGLLSCKFLRSRNVSTTESSIKPLYWGFVVLVLHITPLLKPPGIHLSIILSFENFQACASVWGTTYKQSLCTSISVLVAIRILHGVKENTVKLFSPRPAIYTINLHSTYRRHVFNITQMFPCLKFRFK